MDVFFYLHVPGLARNCRDQNKKKLRFQVKCVLNKSGKFGQSNSDSRSNISICWVSEIAKYIRSFLCFSTPFRPASVRAKSHPEDRVTVINWIRNLVELIYLDFPEIAKKTFLIASSFYFPSFFPRAFDAVQSKSLLQAREESQFLSKQWRTWVEWFLW